MSKLIDIKLTEDVGDGGVVRERHSLKMSPSEFAPTPLYVGGCVSHRGGEVLGADLGDVDCLVEIIAPSLGGVESLGGFGEGIRALIFSPMTSLSWKPNVFSAAALNERMRPRSSMTIIASGIVSRIERRCASRAKTGSLAARSSEMMSSGFTARA